QTLALQTRQDVMNCSRRAQLEMLSDVRNRRSIAMRFDVSRNVIVNLPLPRSNRHQYLPSLPPLENPPLENPPLENLPLENLPLENLPLENLTMQRPSQTRSRCLTTQPHLVRLVAFFTHCENASNILEEIRKSVKKILVDSFRLFSYIFEPC